MNKSDRVDFFERQLENKLFEYEKLNTDLKQRDVPANLSYKKCSVEVRGTLREKIIEVIESEIGDLELALAIIHVGEKATNKEILDKVMSNYCERHFVCNSTDYCHEDDTCFGVDYVPNCNNCSAHATCDKCVHSKDCPYLFDYDKKEYVKKAIQEKAQKFCVDFSETGWGEPAKGDISCNNCSNPCLYRKTQNVFVFEQSALEKLNEGSIERAKELLKTNTDPYTMTVTEMDLGL